MSVATIKNQKGFTLIEIIAVLVLLGILAAVAVPKYMDIAEEARAKATQGQIAEVKGRLATSLAGYMIANSGSKPANGADLLTYVATIDATACPTSSTTEGDFTFQCTGGTGTTQTVTITVSAVQNTTLTSSVTGTYTFN